VAAAWLNTADRDTIRSTFRRGWFILNGELPDGRELTPRWLWRGRRFAENLAAIDAQLAKPTTPETGDLSRFELWRQKCLTLQRLGRAEEADEAARTVMSLMKELEPVPEKDVSDKYSRLGWALACAGRRDEAIAAGRQAIQVLAASNRIQDRWTQEIALAKIHAHFGQKRECVELLAKLLRVPSGITVPMLRVEPDWDNMREDTGFKALLADPKNAAPL
jgi:tetratricopeptide (TPR) repeat protein